MKSMVHEFDIRRIAFGAILLFLCYTSPAQVRLRSSLLKANPAPGDIPQFILRLQHSPDSGIESQSETDNTFLAQRIRGLVSVCEISGEDDSLGVRGIAAVQDTTLPSKSPGLAMLLSAIVPGSGQIYVHRYITIPIIWGFGYYFAWAWNTQNKNYLYYRDLFSASVKADSAGQGIEVYQKDRDFYRDDRDKFAFYLAITYVLNIIDAYVGASLYSFDVSDNLGGSAALRIRIPIQ